LDLKDLYPAIEAASLALSPMLEPVVDDECKWFGLTRQELFILTAVPTFEPEPVSARLLKVRSPYTSPNHLRTRLEILAAGGMLIPADGDGFHLSEQGLGAIKEFMQALHTVMAGIQPMPITRMMDLASRLKDLADACLEAPEPPGTWCIRHARRLDPGRKAPMMARIDQFFDELRAYRDDAHLAAWHGYEENGHAWDILTYLWVEKQAVLGIINQALKRRGNSMEETLTAVSGLIRKGWVSREGDSLRITPFGREIRRTAEATTDRYFLAPLRRFTELELEQAVELINEYRKGIPSLAG